MLATGDEPSAPPLAQKVIAWQGTHGRHGLPWQASKDPYRVWLSEVMLQQTQVATVMAYYARFLQRFPTVTDLASASLDEVLALWSGLGYYSRARNLHRCAQQVVAAHGGEFPRDSAALQQLPGIGRSTAAAVAAICFGERVAILDGNVKRVLARVLAFDEDLASAAAVNALWLRAQQLVPGEDVAIYTQGLMDLGATVCLARAPSCLLCPLQQDCAARRLGMPEQFPRKSRRLKRGQRRSLVLCLQHQGRWWLQQRPPQGVWGGLWALPLFDDEAAFAELSKDWNGTPTAQATIEHALTHFDWTLLPLAWRLGPRLPKAVRVATETVLGPGRWVTPEQALAMGLPAPVRKLLQAATP